MMMQSPELLDQQLQLYNKLLDIIAEELDIPVAELQDDDTEFSEIGIDPIVAPFIVTRISKSTALRLPENVFEIYRDVGHLKQHIITTLVSVPAKATVDRETTLSVLIRGNRARATKNIFLLPDGSGSAMAYARTPEISPEYCIYAMNSPFLQQANKYTCSIQHLASIWTQEIRKIQPRGPYILGGWSAGGYYAYEVMKIFHQNAEVVEKIILIDSPSRTDFEALPLDVVLFLSSNNLMGNWGNIKTPQWLIGHFEATLRAVDNYKPAKVVPPTATPEVFIIWASDALLTEGTTAQIGLDLNIKVTRFLLQRRIDYGPNGWDKLFPGANIAIARMPGNHFNIIHSPNASTACPSINIRLTYHRSKLSGVYCVI